MDSDYVKPKYKIGDIVVYRDRENDEYATRFIQSRIVSAISLKIPSFDDPSEWSYYTEDINEKRYDPLEEDEIIEKLN